MKAAVVTIVIAVAGTLISGYLLDWFNIGDDPPPEVDPVAEPRVVALSPDPVTNRIGSEPAAEVEVENRGTITAEDCVVWWQPGGPTDVPGLPAFQRSKAFALQPDESLTLAFQSSHTWKAAGAYDSKARISCSNAPKPHEDVEPVLVY